MRAIRADRVSRAACAALAPGRLVVFTKDASVVESTASKGTPTRCMDCDAPLENPMVCSDCKSIFPPTSDLTHFERLGLPESYRVDHKDLERRYLKWSRELHPDYFQDRPDSERQLSLALSAALNDAYSTLKDPFRRAEYLLRIHGGPTASEDRVMPEEFLEEILELRMEIAEAKESAEHDPGALQPLRDRLTRERNAALAQVATLFDALTGEQDDSHGSRLALIRKELNKTKYLDGLLRDIAD